MCKVNNFIRFFYVNMWKTGLKTSMNIIANLFHLKRKAAIGPLNVKCKYFYEKLHFSFSTLSTLLSTHLLVLVVRRK